MCFRKLLIRLYSSTTFTKKSNFVKKGKENKILSSKKKVEDLFFQTIVSNRASNR
jgi:hypothetical protein